MQSQAVYKKKIMPHYFIKDELSIIMMWHSQNLIGVGICAHDSSWFFAEEHGPN